MDSSSSAKIRVQVDARVRRWVSIVGHTVFESDALVYPEDQVVPHGHTGAACLNAALASPRRHNPTGELSPPTQSVYLAADRIMRPWSWRVFPSPHSGS